MSKHDNWNWDSDESREDVIIKKVCAVAVYLNPSDGVVIRQEDPMGDEDHFIVIPKEYVSTLVKALNDIIQ